MLPPLTVPVMLELLKDLAAAHPANLRAMQDPMRTADIYFRGLHGLPAEGVRWAVQRSIEDDQYFPKVARLRELAHSWTKRNTMSFGRLASNSPNECSVCGARAESIPITRRKRELVGEPAKWVDVLDEQGHPVIETVMSQGMHMIHDRMRHGLTQSAEQESVA